MSASSLSQEARHRSPCRRQSVQPCIVALSCLAWSWRSKEQRWYWRSKLLAEGHDSKMFVRYSTATWPSWLDAPRQSERTLGDTVLFNRSRAFKIT